MQTESISLTRLIPSGLSQEGPEAWTARAVWLAVLALAAPDLWVNTGTIAAALAGAPGLDREAIDIAVSVLEAHGLVTVRERGPYKTAIWEVRLAEFYDPIPWPTRAEIDHAAAACADAQPRGVVLFPLWLALAVMSERCPRTGRAWVKQPDQVRDVIAARPRTWPRHLSRLQGAGLIEVGKAIAMGPPTRARLGPMPEPGVPSWDLVAVA